MFKVGDLVKLSDKTYAHIENTDYNCIRKVTKTKKKLRTGSIEVYVSPPVWEMDKTGWMEDRFILAEKKKNPTFRECMEKLDD